MTTQLLALAALAIVFMLMMFSMHNIDHRIRQDPNPSLAAETIAYSAVVIPGFLTALYLILIAAGYHF